MQNECKNVQVNPIMKIKNSKPMFILQYIQFEICIILKYFLLDIPRISMSSYRQINSNKSS